MLEKIQIAGQVHDANPAKTYQTNVYLTDSNSREDGKTQSAYGRPTGT